jgi:hypothetical protein
MEEAGEESEGKITVVYRGASREGRREEAEWRAT